MQTVLLHSESTTDLHLLTELAKKIGITVKYLSEEEEKEILAILENYEQITTISHKK